MSALTINALIVVAVTVAATFATRVFPFALFGRKKDGPPKIVKYLGDVLPPTVIAILLVYCMKTIEFAKINTYVPQLISIGIVVILHIWKRNNLISIGGGTVCYMILVQSIFV